MKHKIALPKTKLGLDDAEIRLTNAKLREITDTSITKMSTALLTFPDPTSPTHSHRSIALLELQTSQNAYLQDS